jgi:hypothetical protein
MGTQKQANIEPTDLVLAYLEKKAIAIGGRQAIAQRARFVYYGETEPGFTVRIATGNSDLLATYRQAINDVVGQSKGFRESGGGYQRESVTLSFSGDTDSVLENIQQNDPEVARAAQTSLKRGSSGRSAS